MPITVRVENFQSIEDATVVIDGFTVITGPNNSGKALANGTTVASPTGWIPVESLQVGDFVLAGDGSPTKVVGVYPQGQRETCVITFNDGRQATVDLDHLWKVSIGEARFHNGKGQGWSVVSTRDIWDRVGDIPSRFQRPAVPTPGPAQYTPLPTPLDPYLMGLLLGDGCFQPTSVRISSADVEVLCEVSLALPQGVSLNPCGKYDYRLRTQRGQPNPVLDAVRELGLVGLKAHEKFIPPDYLWNDVDTRVAILQGLLDSDGGVNKQGIAEYYSTSPFLTDGVAEIVRSLGGSARVRIKEKPTYTYKGEKKIGRQCFTVSIRLPLFPLFRLPRKLEKVETLSRRIQPLMVAFSKGPVVGCTCIEVEHDSHLFQMEGHLVTHNTAFMRAVRGVFLNSPPGSIVRRGSAHLTVTIDFGEGNTVKWEKGWEKPEKKGKTVNRYHVNGKELSDVGRGCPPEVLALGMNPIKAGSDNVWPQIADQFKGVLFLVGSPGSSMAEAIANVDKVGKLSAALKLSESERRSIVSKLKVRRGDEKDLAAEVEAFDGIDDVADQVDAVETAITEAETLFTEYAVAKSFRKRWKTAHDEVVSLKGIEGVEFPPDPSDIELVRDELADLSQIRNTIKHRRTEVEHLSGIGGVDVPDSDAATAPQTSRDELADLRRLSTRLKASRATLATMDGYDDVALPDTTKTVKIKGVVSFFKELQRRRNTALSNIEQLKEDLRLSGVEQVAAEQGVTVLLGELGECPTCGTVTADGKHVHEGAA